MGLSLCAAEKERVTHSNCFKSFFGGKYPGFEIFSGDQNDITSEIVSKKVSQNLGRLSPTDGFKL